jgi:hypothetical protein
MRRLQHLLCIMGILSFLFGGCGKQSASQSKATTQTMPPGQISFSQLDITERFDDHLHLNPEDWISTVPLNKSVPNGKGLPPVGASIEEVYKAATRLVALSQLLLTDCRLRMCEEHLSVVRFSRRCQPRRQRDWFFVDESQMVS